MTMFDRLKTLVFYCPNDEGGELFSFTCKLCYKAVGLGYTTEAEYLFKWATEQAEDSKQWCIREGRDLEEEDSLSGDCCIY